MFVSPHCATASSMFCCSDSLAHCNRSVRGPAVLLSGLDAGNVDAGTGEGLTGPLYAGRPPLYWRFRAVLPGRTVQWKAVLEWAGLCRAAQLRTVPEYCCLRSHLRPKHLSICLCGAEGRAAPARPATHTPDPGPPTVATHIHCRITPNQINCFLHIDIWSLWI